MTVKLEAVKMEDHELSGYWVMEKMKEGSIIKGQVRQFWAVETSHSGSSYRLRKVKKWAVLKGKRVLKGFRTRKEAVDRLLRMEETESKDQQGSSDVSSM